MDDHTIFALFLLGWGLGIASGVLSERFLTVWERRSTRRATLLADIAEAGRLDALTNEQLAGEVLESEKLWSHPLACELAYRLHPGWLKFTPDEEDEINSREYHPSVDIRAAGMAMPSPQSDLDQPKS